MNQKIDLAQEEISPREKEFSSRFFPSLILLTVAVLVFVVISENQGGSGYKHESRVFSRVPTLFTLFPAVFVSGITVDNGLQAFSGKTLASTNLALEIWTLVSILIVYVIIPTVFFFNWRRRRIENKSISTSPPLNLSSVSYALCMILITSIVVTAIMSSVVTHRSLEHAQAIQSDRDEIIIDLVRISLGAYQYRLLPKELGGGQGTYLGFKLTPERAKTQNGIYTASASENQVTVKAQSLLYPTGIIHAPINEQGELRNLSYEGVFN